MLTVGGGAGNALRNHKSVRNSDVEVSRTPDLKFWMLLGGGESEIDHVRCVRYRAASTKLWGDTFMDTVPEPDLVRSASPKHEMAFAKSRKSSRARTEGTPRSLATAGGPQFLLSGLG